LYTFFSNLPHCGVIGSCWACKAGTAELQVQKPWSQCTAAGWSAGSVECQLASQIAHTHSRS